ncbi:hypothetical protein HAHE_38190 [Haloferula helveola]|uniref:DUF2167 domain-containing protein n=1 Tax=Haloferula helveola TaxID=490095 RepID=A0ABM7RHM3_9BACT|nr:hypothetical protein HAHE_38190 [Haloferula helveola]
MLFRHLLPTLLFPVFCLADDSAPLAGETEATPEELQAGYEAYINHLIGEDPYLTGDVELPGGMAQLHLPSGYRFLPADGAKKVIVDLWGNPPGSAEDALGLVLPEGQSLENTDSWAIVVEFTDDGYVADDDADEIDYDELLETLQEGANQSNSARIAEGYETIDIVGWAVPPHYDKENKVLHWAKELKFGGTDENTVNYDVRVLGRRGVLNMQGVAAISSVPAIREAAPQIVGMVEYLPGHRYADFDPETDKKSDMSLAGLVVGGAVAAKLAAKAGIFAKLGIILAKGWKLILIGAIALGAVGKKIFAKNAA